MLFREKYAQLRAWNTDSVRERPDEVSESHVQCIWYDQLFADDALMTDQDQPMRVVSPGWWNRGEGPDFKGAQIEFNGTLRTGDVEIHLNHVGWTQHGHHLDNRYDDVILHVVLDASAPKKPARTSAGKHVPCLLLQNYLKNDLQELAQQIAVEEYPHSVEGTYGRCAAQAEAVGPENLAQLLSLAGEWRMLFKARALRERMERAGPDQGIYETFLAACGFSHFKHHFTAIARQFPYDRVRQLAREDALLLEAAFLQVAGLLPDNLPTGRTALPHFGRLRALRCDRLPGLKSLPLEWKRVGVRPNNNPERRLAGAARLLAKTAQEGLADALDTIWSLDLPSIERRRKFEDLFPAPMGFWSTHCTWTGKKMATPTAPLGAGRVRSIIGNVFVPAALASARMNKDRSCEERILAFFADLPREPENKIQKDMLPRLFGSAKRPRLDFRMQQGILQMFYDWCEPNPSCQNCRVTGYLDG